MPKKAPPARRLTPGPDRDKLAQDLKKKYDSGASIRALAEETGRSYGGVHRLLEDAGATFRSRGGAPRRTEP
ncbi:helix-turn-helix domain-containing protein [Streptomyces sp. NPDC021012]|uniref:helix-turn-helix domain-containing protein n=1 Tax=Streptomyces sp. NPDC021012 TaxID=3365107 RepID=UPI0037AD5D27